MCLTWTVGVPAVPADSQSAPPAHPETSAAFSSGYETRPAKNTRTNMHEALWFPQNEQTNKQKNNNSVTVDRF